MSMPVKITHETTGADLAPDASAIVHLWRSDMVRGPKFRNYVAPEKARLVAVVYEAYRWDGKGTLADAMFEAAVNLHPDHSEQLSCGGDQCVWALVKREGRARSLTIVRYAGRRVSTEAERAAS